MALAGMPSYRVSSGPERAQSALFLYRRNPNAPSVPVPESTIQTALSPGPRPMSGERSRWDAVAPALDRLQQLEGPFQYAISLSGGMTYTQFGLTSIRLQLKDVHSCISLQQLDHHALVLGARCGIRTKAIPLSAAICVKNCSNASNPPAEAPMPTM